MEDYVGHNCGGIIGLISALSSKKCANHYPLYLDSAQDSDLAHFLEEGKTL